MSDIPSSFIAISYLYNVICNVVLKLFWLVSLGLIITYIYSMGAFAFFANEIDNTDTEEANYCDSLFQCWITVFHYILLGGRVS